ncbi:hypothetical protein LAU_0173 [Lausannevirus]|uniref:Uncharacterized protein n=1 Tax=Lausannevirus TaxID=999883 RepID=F2WLA1_9VIRU|nr:hypothetical protein LAU_0173 [Lausannevirus]AEA07024.1 hypothetical protein LAU_0173 [Lausannevirus]
MATSNFDTSSLINAVLNAILQQQQQTQNTNNIFDPANIAHIFGHSPPTPEPLTPQRNASSRRSAQPPNVVSVKDKKILMALGLVLLKLHERGNLTSRIENYVNEVWSTTQNVTIESFRDNVLGNVQTLLGEEDTSLELFDGIVYN